MNKKLLPYTENDLKENKQAKLIVAWVISAGIIAVLCVHLAFSLGWVS